MNDEHDNNVTDLTEHRSGGPLISPTWFGVADSMNSKDGTRGVSLFLEWGGQRTGFHFDPDDADFLADQFREQARKARERMDGNGSENDS